MFQVWFEDLIEVSEYGNSLNRLTREIQHELVGSIFFHSDDYMFFAFYFDGWER